MRLSDKIRVGLEEVGLTPFYCAPDLERLCKDRYVGKFPEKYLGYRHCVHQIPFFVASRLENICHYRIEEYWKK